ncbi:hypothetical protein [Polyangium sp. 15x6]|uniref:hypothetical protein n=1 Tax=Polyangium sp. 15x6 TaxID=3042687 RepID=UPI00249B015F|nr:hypothetical protein [Polyangium sp. 15x6]MDI3285164.1 hypothetical protein [Polyangium sp. 15x6]
MTARRDGDWFVGATFTINGSPIRLAATASEATVRAALAKLGHIAEPSTGGFFDTIANAISKFARSKAVQSVLQGVATVAKNPMVRDLAKAWPAMGTALDYIGKGAEAAASAQSLIMRSQNGDAKAKAAIASVSTAARQGNPNAQVMHRVLGSVYGRHKQEQAAQAQRPPPPRPAAPPPSAPRLRFPMYPQPAPPNPYGPQTQPVYPYGPPVSAGAALDADPDLIALARTVRATG